eukprot:GEMP01048128.1.p1 GENE.GEMP01048128.1~~GEMP01048128.1.p1  ORF type:complete len:277 (+),score=69.00 GEMP01048128.1:250-1080(+)
MAARHGTAPSVPSGPAGVYADKTNPFIGDAKIGYIPEFMKEDIQIRELVNLYQQQLVELNACHSLLQADQELLARKLAPYKNESGQLVVQEPSDDVLLFKQGLELRIAEFKEDCTRIHETEKKLERLIRQATTDYERSLNEVSETADSRILRRLRQQSTLIQVQQNEVDQLRLEKNILEAQTRKLRELTKYGHWADDKKRSELVPQGPLDKPVNLHNLLYAKYQPWDTNYGKDWEVSGDPNKPVLVPPGLDRGGKQNMQSGMFKSQHGALFPEDGE